MVGTKKLWFMRAAICWVGVTFTCIAASVFYLVGMGSDPYQVFVMALHRMVGITYGQANMILNGMIVCFFLIFQRKYINLAMVLSVFYSGPCIDLMNTVLSVVIVPDLSIIMRAFLSVSGCIILAFGCYLYMSADMGASPPDGVGLFISEKAKIPYKWIRIGTDVFFLGVGMALGGTAGFATAAAVVLTGPLIGVFQENMPSKCWIF